MQKHTQNSGATMIEYILAFSIMLVIALWLSDAITTGGTNRANTATQSINGQHGMAPCVPGGPLNIDSAECY